jgi:hypothetical protein
MYTAVVLDEKSHLKLVKWAEDNIKVNGVRLPVLLRDNGWKLVCHHMTIAMGNTPAFLQQYLGTSQKLDVTHYGVSDNAIAVRVVGFYSKNLIPHITVAVNVKDGGKAVDSNKIAVWTPVDASFKLSGEVKEMQ